MLNHRNNMHEACLTPIFVGHKLHEANQVVLGERANENASIQESRFHSTQGLEILPVMPKAFPLADRRFVVDSAYSPNEDIVEKHLPDDDPGFRGFPNLIPDLEINLMCHPVIKGRNAEGGDVVPFHWMAIFR